MCYVSSQVSGKAEAAQVIRGQKDRTENRWPRQRSGPSTPQPVRRDSSYAEPPHASHHQTYQVGSLLIRAPQFEERATHSGSALTLFLAIYLLRPAEYRRGVFCEKERSLIKAMGTSTKT